MDNNNKIRVGITHGDTNGIGYELIFKAFADPSMLELCTPIVYGSPKVATYHRNALGIEANFTIINSAAEAVEGRLNMLPVFEEEVKVELGTPTAESARAAVQALDAAITDYKDGNIDVLVTCPVNQNGINVEGLSFANEAHYIETSIGEGKKALSLMINEQLRVATMTDSIALRDVAQQITATAIINKVAQLFTTLRKDMRISSPRIAVLALNPNDSEEHPGKEETEAIIPAVTKLSEAGVCAFGPYQAAEFFGSDEYTAFDAVLAMYYDQGMTPLRALAPDCNIRYLGNLPLVATSVEMGPGYDIAGQGVADEQPLRHAIYAAIDGFRNRNDFDAPYANPLPKLYHERRDESEKVRFSIPKKHDGQQKERRQNTAAQQQEGAKTEKA